MWGEAGGAGAEPGPHEWEVRTRQRGRSSPTALAGGSRGPGAHGLAQPHRCLPTMTVPAPLLWSHPMLAPACARPDAFAPSQPHQWGPLGLCGVPPRNKGFL